MEGYEEDGATIFLAVQEHSTISNAHKLKHMKLYPNMRL